MTIQFRAVNAPAAVGGTTLVINKPTGTLTDDFLVMQTMGPVEVPDTWTLIPQSEIDDPAKDIALWYRVATASEPANYTVVGTSSAVSACIVGFFSDAAQPIHVDAIANQINASNTNRDWPSVTVAASASMLCCFASMGNATSTPAAGFTERWDLDNPKRYLMTKALAASGATGTVTATGTAIASNCVTLALSEGTQAAFSGPQYRGHRGVAIASAPNSISIVVPAALVVGDLMVMTLIMDTLKTVTTPTGWTLLTSMVAATPDLYVFTKIAVAGDIGATITISYTSGAVGAGVSMVAYFSPAGKFLSVDTFATSVNASSASELFPSVTTTKAIAQLLYVGGMSGNFGINTQPVGTHQRYFSGSGPRFNELTHALFASGATGTYTLTRAGANNSNTITVAVVELDAIIGIEATTLDALTLAATGLLPIVGTLAATLANLTLSATAKLAIVGSLAVTLQNATLVSSAPLAIVGSLAVTLADATLAGAGAAAIAGSLAVTLDDLILAATGKLVIVGSAGITLQNLTLTAGGRLAIVGSEGITLDDLALAAVGRLVTAASLAVTLEDVALTATAKLAIVGSEGVTLEALTLAAEGVLAPFVPSLLVTALPVLVELTGAGVDVGEMLLLVEMAASGVYVSELPVLVEVGAVGVYVTQEAVLIELEFFEPEEIMPVTLIANAGTRRMHASLPDEVTGYAFDPLFSWWSAVVAEESTNLIINPSFEGWTAPGVVLEFDDGGVLDDLSYVEFPSVGATAGRRCAKLTSASSSGYLAYTTLVHVAPGPYTFSCDVYVTRAPFTVTLEIVDDGDLSIKAKRQFRMMETGWQRFEITYVELGVADVEPRLVLNSGNPAGVVVYTDAWQFEAKKYATTYLDGDMIGFSDSSPNQSYYWLGEPHHSPSTRRKRTGSGGRVVSWSQEAHFRTTSIVGLGMTTVEQKTQTLGDGREVHLALLDKARDFTVTGRIFAGTPRELRQRSNDLISLLKRNNTPGGDQMKIRFQETDDQGRAQGATLEIVCAYRDGMQGNMTNFYQTNLPLQFHAVDPYPADIIESSAALQFSLEVSSDGLFYRDQDGVFHDLTAGGEILDGVVQNVGFLRDGTMIAIGDFSHINGDVVSGAAWWDGENWQQLGTPAPDSANDIDDGFRLGYPLTLASQDGNVYEWDELGETWNTLGSHGFNNAIYAMQRDMNGDIWIGGEFNFAEDGVTKFHRVARYNAATLDWEQLGGGVSDPYDFFPDPIAVHAVLASNDGSVYFGGSFGEGDANYDPLPPTVLAKGVARWDIATATWNRVGSGLGGSVQHLLRGPDGYIYAVGDFTTDAGLNPFPLRGFARFNGSNWEEVFELVDQFGVHGADGVTIDDQGIFWFYNFVGDSDQDLFVVPGLGEVGNFGWRDGIFYPPDVPDAGMHSIAYGPANIALYSAHSYLGGSVMYVPAVNEINYGGSADAPLLMRLHGSGQFLHALNLSTEGGIYGRGDFVIGEGEEVFIRTDSQRNMVYSNQRVNISGQVSVGASNMKALRLVPGINRISMLITHVDEVASGYLVWKNRYASLMEGVQ